MATRKPGEQNTNGNRNRRQNRYGNAGADNDVSYRFDTEATVSNNRVRARFADMPRTA